MANTPSSRKAARAALATYESQPGFTGYGDDHETAILDLIADLAHLADWYGGGAAGTVLERAAGHYLREVDEDTAPEDAAEELLEAERAAARDAAERAAVPLRLGREQVADILDALRFRVHFTGRKRGQLLGGLADAIEHRAGKWPEGGVA